VAPKKRGSKSRGKGPGRPPLTQTQRVLNAVKRGAQDAKTIARKARVPLAHVHPLLNRLRERGQVDGFTGNLRAVDNQE
jgi:predicted Rossmann fold nucleotide-binding protein DprA/Smf involved in DNA uptake